jgi:hypothetical protein
LESKENVFKAKNLRKDTNFWYFALGYDRNRLHVSSDSDYVQDENILINLLMKRNKLDFNLFILPRVNHGLLGNYIELLITSLTILRDSEFKLERNSRSVNNVQFFCFLELIRNCLEI